MIRWAQDEGILIPDWPEDLQPSNRTLAGAEHFAWHFGTRWVKATYGLGVGLHPCLDDRTEFGWVLKPGDPSTYISRLQLANDLFADDFVLHALLADEHGTLSAITSQPDRAGTFAPMHVVTRAMGAVGFQSVGEKGTYFRAEDGIAIFDLHEENIVYRDGRLYPIDAVIVRVDEDLREMMEWQLHLG